MSEQSLLIVESPAKSKTITKYLGKNFIVLSSKGHVRGIPSKSNAVNTENNFETEYEIHSDSMRYLDEITKAAKNSQHIYMATDPDREGEAISWHILEVLKERKIPLDNKVHRVTFNEVTPEAVKAAIKSPRSIDMNLVSAQRARQCLDYLVGFSISPILWRKLPGSKSAGRVQSVALRILCEREHEIIRFKPIDYWTIPGEFSKDSEQFSADLIEINRKKVEKFSFLSESAANSVVSVLKQLNYSVESVEHKEVQRNPEPPFITSTLIQAASTNLKMSSKKAMQVAQKLYEGMKVNDKMIGLITYMRTDSINLSSESVEKGREAILEIFGKNYLPENPRVFKSKVKNAQEAHEAIRPTDPFLTPEKIKEFLTDDEFALYELIWKRFIACQMSSARIAKTTIRIAGQNDNVTLENEELNEFMSSSKGTTAVFRVIGTMVLFDGFSKVMNDSDSKKKGDDVLLPRMFEKDILKLIKLNSKQHTTTAPSRYSEATLVKKMEDLGIGRPSTYATVMSILQERQYVSLQKNKFFVEDRGELVNTFLNCFFPRYVEYGFTAALEEELDDIANGEKQFVEILQNFWTPFKTNVNEVGGMQTITILSTVQNVLNEFLFDETNSNRKCPKCSDGDLILKNSKYSPFIGCSNYPECDYAQKFKLYSTFENKTETSAKELLQTKEEDAPLMIHSGNIRVIAQENEEQIMLNKGQYGHYISLCKNGLVQKNFTLPSFVNVENFSLAFSDMRKLFDMPMSIGKHSDGNDIKIGIGRYGPYVLYKKKFYSIKTQDILSVIHFSVEQAENIISNKK